MPELVEVGVTGVVGAQLGSAMLESGEITQIEMVHTAELAVPSFTIYVHVAEPTNHAGGI